MVFNETSTASGGFDRRHITTELLFRGRGLFFFPFFKVDPLRN